ncbi:hypothetical protein [Actinosynnema sp. NPDC023587]|uniref:hypothetical protein n=1 Tax=Actinosynnema sp. NPDC023587 TaxID=3154695 RepID=UPI0033DC7CF9
MTRLAVSMRSTRTTLRQLAELAGTGKDTVHRLARGRQVMVAGTVGARIEKALGVPAGSLFVYARLGSQRVASARQDAA